MTPLIVYIVFSVLASLVLFMAVRIVVLKQQLCAFEQKATIDELTGLPNRTAMYETLNHEVARAKRNDVPLVIAFIDLDGFKNVNDRSGHHVGDELLAAVAHKMRDSLREYDTLCRFGGDEFVAIIPGVRNNVDALTVGDKIIKAANQAIMVSTEQTVGASIGIVTYPTDDTDPDELLKKADKAMYAAKEAGKNRVCIWSEKIHEVESQPKAKRSMVEALDNGQIELWYQPQRDIKTLAIIGAEGLIRWRHPDYGILGPTEFLSLVDHAGLSDAYAQRVAELICDNAKEIVRKIGFRAPKLWMNVSPAQLISKRHDIVGILAKMTVDKGIDPSSIGIEMTEERFMADSSLFSAKLVDFKMRGFGVAIDDFGVGRFSMMDLRNLTFDKIKIDKSLVRNIESDERQRLIMSAIVNMAKTIGYVVCVEGVEMDEEFHHVRMIGADEVQGFIFDRPMPFDELLAAL